MEWERWKEMFRERVTFNVMKHIRRREVDIEGYYIHTLSHISENQQEQEKLKYVANAYLDIVQ